LEALTAHAGDVNAATRVAAEACGRPTSELLASLLVWLPAAVEAAFVTAA
jgi:hypothetical protein